MKHSSGFFRRYQQYGVTMLALATFASPVAARPFPLLLMPDGIATPYEAAKTRSSRGDAAAEFWMGEYAAGYGTDLKEHSADYVAALSWLIKADTQGYKPARGPLAYLQGQRAEYESHLAAAQTGNPQAEYDLSIYMQSADEGWHMRDNAPLWLNRAAEHGQPDAEYAVGTATIDKWAAGDRSDITFLQTGFRWLESASQQGHIDAQMYLTALYAQDTPYKNDEKALAWMQVLSAHSFTVPKTRDDKEAWAFFRIARTTENLCNHYEGASVDLAVRVNSKYIETSFPGAYDVTKAFACHTRLAQTTNWKGEYALGYDYQYGLGTPIDKDKAVAAYLTQTTDNDGRLNYGAMEAAMIRLGLIYEERQDYEQSYLWLQRAQHGRSHKAGERDDISPEAALPSVSPEVESRLQVYDLGSAALVRVSDKLSPEVRAAKDVEVANTMRQRSYQDNIWIVPIY